MDLIKATIIVILVKLAQTASIMEETNAFNAINPDSGKEYRVFDVRAPNPDSCGPSDFPPDPKTPCCGIIADPPVPIPSITPKSPKNSKKTKRSIGGEGTTLEQYPWLALLEPKRDSGFMVSSRYIVTAAACLVEGTATIKPTNVVLGDYNKNTEGPDCVHVAGGEKYCNDGAVRIPVDNVVIHPKYNETWNRNDVGLVKLKEMAPYTKFIRPICLPSSDVTDDQPKKPRLDFVGWGVVAQYYNPIAKYYTDVDVPERLRVDLAFKTIEECTKLWNWPLWNKHICAGGDGKSPCHGDGGGPLMMNNKGRVEVIGLSTNTAIPCGHKNGPGVFTNVFKYKSWIQSQMELMSEE